MFPSTNDITTQEQNNNNVQQVILATRPYGATPLAGMLTGAQYYFQTDPLDPSSRTDTSKQVPKRIHHYPYGRITQSRPAAGVHISGSPSGVCPFQLPETIAGALYQPSSSSNQLVTTYALGFAVSSVNDDGTLVNCSSLVSNGQLAAICSDTTNPTRDALYALAASSRELPSPAEAGTRTLQTRPGISMRLSGRSSLRSRGTRRRARRPHILP